MKKSLSNLANAFTLLPGQMRGTANSAGRSLEPTEGSARISIGKRTRYNFIDCIRGIAACLVLVQHSLEISRIQSTRHGNFGEFWLNFGETGVLAFFLVSGFVIPLSLEKWNDLRHFWINRAFRIYPLYIAIYIVTLVVARGVPVIDIPYSFMVHLLFIQEYLQVKNFVGASWTLSLEACWYLGFSLLFALSLNKKLQTVISGTVLLAMVGCTISLANVARIPMGRVSLLVACVLGLLCYRKEQGEVTRKVFVRVAIILTAAIVVDLVIGFSLRPSAILNAPSLRCVMLSWSLGGLFFAVPFATRKSAIWDNSVLKYLGKISYSIYLVHPLLLMLLSRMGLSGFALIALIIPLTIGVSAASYKFIEFPAISFSHGLRKKRLVSVQLFGES